MFGVSAKMRAIGNAISGVFGQLYDWGGSAFLGVLGNNNATVNQSSPIQIGTVGNWSSVVAGGSHFIATKSDGTLWTWGTATNGVLGDGQATVSKSSPCQLGTKSDWAGVAAGASHNLAYKTDGTLWAWGGVGSVQIGDNAAVARSSPVQIGTLSSWVGVFAANTTSFARKSDGTLWAWGLGTSGQLGDGTTVSKSSPVQIGAKTDWLGVAGGFCHTIAYKTDGTLWTWGAAGSGCLGNNQTTASTSSPAQLGTISAWAGVAAGNSHVVAYKTDGTIWGWGNNTIGQVGDITLTNRSSPVQIGTLTTWSGISSGNCHNVAYKTDGSIWSWGNGTLGQLGDNIATVVPSPIQLGTELTWNGVSAGFGIHSLALNSLKQLWAWGGATDGQDGDITVISRSSPVIVGATTTTWSGVSAGKYHSLAMRSDGSLWAWGRISSGQVGDNQLTVPRSSPVIIGTTSTWSAFAAGAYHSLGRRTAGTLWAWGMVTSGQVGDNQILTARSSPVQIGTLTTWSVVAAGASHSLAYKTDGTLWAWGLNTTGQLGINSITSPISSPVQVGTLTTWATGTVISGGGTHTLVRKTDGSLWGWGSNSFGAVGNSAFGVNASTPVQIGTITIWSGVSAGGSHSLAYKTDGTLWAWGSNIQGQLGDGTLVTKSSPIQIGTITIWSGVSAGASHSLAYKTDGTIWAWGYRTNGRIGDNVMPNKSSPVQIGTTTGWKFITAGNSATVSSAVR